MLLPDTLHELLDLALNDFDKVMEDDKYAVNMGGWHLRGYGKKKCRVCLAGSVMAKTLAVRRWHDAWPSDYDNDTSRKLFAINDLRLGNLNDAYYYVYGENPSKNLDKEANVSYFLNNAENWRADMAAVLEILKREGI